jgi:hypothetical protein
MSDEKQKGKYPAGESRTVKTNANPSEASHERRTAHSHYGKPADHLLKHGEHYQEHAWKHRLTKP